MAKIKLEKNTIYINMTQMMVGKQWVESWCMCRWAGEANTQVKEASSNKGYEAERNTFRYKNK